MRHLLICYCFIHFFSANLFAQLPYRYFNKLTIQDGLSHNNVNCITQDKRGFIWIGTNDGLNRFDGKNFTIFRHHPNDNSTISGNIITDLLEDENEILWIATADGGLNRYNYRALPNEQFKQYKNIPGDSTTIPVNIINALTQDEYGYLWLATSGKSVIRFDKKTESFLIPVTGSRKTALAFCNVAGHQLWVGSQGGGLLKINTSNLIYEMDERYNNLYADLPHAAISAIFHDKDKNTWLGSWDKVLYQVNHLTRKEIIFKNNTRDAYTFNDDEAQDFAEDDVKNIWIAGKHNGLHLYEKQTNRFYNYKHEASKEGTIASNTIYCIFIDKKGAIWLGTDKGISIHLTKQQAFKQYFLPSSSNNLVIHDFYKDAKNGLLIGTSEGLFVQEKEDAPFRHYPLSFAGVPLAVTKIYKPKEVSENKWENSEGHFLLGTNISLFNYDLNTRQLSALPGTSNDAVMNKIIDSRIVSIISDTLFGHPVWIVLPYGHYLAYYDLVDKKWVSRMDADKNIIDKFNLKDNLIRKLYKTSNNETWLATAKSGLGNWQKNSTGGVHYFDNNPMVKNSLTNNNIFDITEDKKQNLWISTYGGGLNYFNRQKSQFQHFTESNNLLEGIQNDSKDNVWMISNGNLVKYNITTKSFINYALPDIEKSGGVRGNMYKDEAGKLYVAGSNFFIPFQPETVTEVTSQPACYFTDFKIFNQSFSHLLLQKKLQLQYNQNFFTIEFSAPDFFNGEIQYAYQLEGYDRDWVDAGSRNIVSYSNVEDGNFTFKVRASNKKGNWNRDISSIIITVVPPFWKTWWFYLISIFLVTGTVYALYRYRINELLKRQAIRNKIARDLHDNVGSTLSSISVYSQVAKIYNQQQKQEALQNALEKISDASVDMIGEMSDTVWAINPANDHMDIILQKMESFAKPLLAAKEIKFFFNYNPAITTLNLGMTKRKNFYLIFKESINNAVKYAACSSITVNVQFHHHKMTLQIKDDGRGFNTTPATFNGTKLLQGNGLVNMKRRAEEMNGIFTIESQLNNGTTIQLEFPVP